MSIYEEYHSQLLSTEEWSILDKANRAIKKPQTLIKVNVFAIKQILMELDRRRIADSKAEKHNGIKVKDDEDFITIVLKGEKKYRQRIVDMVHELVESEELLENECMKPGKEFSMCISSTMKPSELMD